MVESTGSNISESTTRPDIFRKLAKFFQCKLLCEDALKLHVFVYWLCCLIKLMKSADESFLATLSVALSAFTLISVLVALAGRKPLFLIPFLIMSVYEVLETIIIINLVNIKVNRPTHFKNLSKNTLCRFFLKNLETISEEYFKSYVVGNFLYATYFLVVVVTTLKVMKSYSDFQTRISTLPPSIIVNQALADQLYIGRLSMMPNDIEIVVANPDSPPHYSEIINNCSNNSLLPKYSQIHDKNLFGRLQQVELSNTKAYYGINDE